MATSESTVIEVHNLGFVYPSSPGREPVRALDAITFSVDRGSFKKILGPSGSGKSTLCRALTGLVPHTTPGVMEGSVRIAGSDTRERPVNASARVIGMVFQDPDSQLFSTTVEDEVVFGLEQLGADEEIMDAAVADAIRLLKIDHLRHSTIDALSWGERQRVAIAATLATAPSVLVLDEPLSGLDAESASALVGTLSALRAGFNLTVIVSEHRTELLAPVADREVVLEEGRLVADRVLSARQGSAVRHPGCRASLPYRQRPGSCPSVEIRGVCFRYPGQSRSALDGVNLDLYPGEVTVLIGANGSGKSTLLRMLNGIIRPERGTVAVRGRPIARRPVADIAREVGVLFQGADYLLFSESIADEISFGPRNLGVSGEECARRTADVVRSLGLDGIPPGSSPLSLSIGERQRVAIGSVLAMETPVVALDEPTLGLDSERKLRLGALLRGLADRGRTVVVATHDRPFGDACADRTVTLHGGRIVTDERNPGPGFGCR